LAHAYHDRVLGFDEPRIREAYEKYKKSGRGEKTLLHDGRRVRHYALTDHKEFFAEMTEAYFGANDFFPFNRAELKDAEPEIYELMRNVWEGPPPSKVPPKAAFKVDGHPAFVILPPAADGKTPVPWVWYAPTFPTLPEPREDWMFERFLAAGVAVAGVDVGESYGSPKGRDAYTALYTELVKNRNFAPRPVLLARSRGGLMLYNWAAEHPEWVGGIAGIYPVCDLRSYPGLDRACGAYGLTREQLEGRLDQHNPVDRLAPLARAGVPIFHLHGDADTLVPLDANSGEVARRYEKLGGKMELSVAKGQGHNLWDGFFQSQELVDFVLAHAVEKGPARRR
jgi:pimeloyl-ACP methyl ester carboxylesterase